MKNLQSRVYASIFVVCVLLLGTIFASVESQTNNEVKVETSEGLTAKNVKIVQINDIPHVRFSVFTESDLLISKLKVRVLGYDNEGNIIAGSLRLLNDLDISKGAKFGSVLALNPDLKPADHYFVQITSAQSSQNTETFQKASLKQQGNCGSDFCAQCSQEARTSCGAGKIGRVTCDQTNCTCDYSCRSPGQP
ncbi:MAG: hypothetical protein ACR2HG_00885 [Pyrinomonadaceae bacterium]